MIFESQKNTYSITLENLLHAQSETNGEAGGGGTDGETGGGGTDGETGGGGNNGGGDTNGTPQAGKHKRDVTKEITKYVKWEGGVKILFNVQVEGSQKTTVTIKWSCCCPGGNGCSSNHPDCAASHCSED